MDTRPFDKRHRPAPDTALGKAHELFLSCDPPRGIMGDPDWGRMELRVSVDEVGRLWRETARCAHPGYPPAGLTLFGVVVIADASLPPGTIDLRERAG